MDYFIRTTDEPYYMVVEVEDGPKVETEAKIM